MSVTRQTCARRWSSSGRGALERSPESLAPEVYDVVRTNRGGDMSGEAGGDLVGT